MKNVIKMLREVLKELDEHELPMAALKISEALDLLTSDQENDDPA